MKLQLFLCKERAASRTVLVASTCPMNGMVGPSRLKACHTKRGGRDLWSCQVKAILGSLMKLVQKLKRNDADDDEWCVHYSHKPSAVHHPSAAKHSEALLIPACGKKPAAIVMVP